MSNSPSRSRGAFSAPEVCNFASLTPNEGGRSAESRSGAAAPVGRAHNAARQALARRLASHDAGRSPLGAPPWRFWAPGPRLPHRHLRRIGYSELLAPRKKFHPFVPAKAGAGMSGRRCHGPSARPAISVRSLSRLRGRVGEGVLSTNLVVCPLPVPPPRAGEGNAPSAPRGRGKRTKCGAKVRWRTQRRLGALLGARSQRGRDPC